MPFAKQLEIIFQPMYTDGADYPSHDGGKRRLE